MRVGEYVRQRVDEDVIIVFFITVFITRAVTHYGVDGYNMYFLIFGKCIACLVT